MFGWVGETPHECLGEEMRGRRPQQLREVDSQSLVSTQPTFSTSVLTKRWHRLMPSLFVCLLLDKSFGIHWESNKTRASTTKYHQEPHEIVNRADTIVILSQLYCVQLRLRNGGPAKLAESSSRQIADAHLPNFRLLQDQIWWRPARAQCLTLGADEDRWAAPAAKCLLKRREQSATVTNEDRNRVQRAPLCHRSPVCQERRKKKTWLANAAGRASCVRFWSTVCC